MSLKKFEPFNTKNSESEFDLWDTFLFGLMLSFTFARQGFKVTRLQRAEQSCLIPIVWHLRLRYLPKLTMTCDSFLLLVTIQAKHTLALPILCLSHTHKHSLSLTHPHTLTLSLLHTHTHARMTIKSLLLWLKFSFLFASCPTEVLFTSTQPRWD